MLSGGQKKRSPKAPFKSTAGGNRTLTTSQSQDFESSASTNSATAAINLNCYDFSFQWDAKV